jgi:hypothetical protein
MIRICDLLGEVRRNIVTGTTRVGLWATVTVLVGLSGALLDESAVVQAERQAAEFQATGAATFHISAGGEIDGARCVALREVPGVQAVAAARQTGDQVTFSTLPSRPVQITEATPGMAEVLGGAQPDGPGLLLPQPMADSIGVNSQTEEVATLNGTAAISGFVPFPDDGREQGMAAQVISPVPATGRFDSCWIRVWPLQDINTLLYYAVVDSPRNPTEIRVTQFNTKLGSMIDPVVDFQTRPSRDFWAFTLAAGLAIGVVAILLRRLEVAGALHAGMAKSALALQLTLESLTWILSAVIVGLPVCLWLALDSPDPPAAALLAGLKPLVATAVGAFIGQLMMTLTITENRLFSYFKARS